MDGTTLRVTGARTLQLPLGGVASPGVPALVQVGTRVAVLFELPSPTGAQIGALILTRDLAPEGAAFSLTRSPGSARTPAATVIDGRIFVAWIDSRQGPRAQVFVGSSAHQSLEAGIDEHAVTAPALPNAPSVAPGPGGAVVAWSDAGQEPVVRAAALPTSGGAAPQVRLGPGRSPAVASIGARVLVAWHDGLGHILTCPFESPGSCGTTARLGDALDAAFPALAALDQGIVVAYWSALPRPGVFATRLTMEGTPSGAAVRLGEASAEPSAPAVVCTDSGVLVAWTGPGGPVLTRLHHDLRIASTPLALGGGTSPRLVASGAEVVAAWITPGPFAGRIALAKVIGA